ncbi:two-component system sensor histidine kinase [Catenuloplanes indicus JCM 9534]|uniref:Signal transduction histidine kinase n=2 Tax=Catenuloplanes indicus TaxID=137267 RepID=A0AAE3W771_9ACTN|nr:signal transduction histidine kinase [Catenuloplanes indicus]
MAVDQPPSLGLGPLSRVRLDELLQEMLDRVGDVVASRERLRALLDAVVGISTDLDLRSTLQRIVEAACSLAGARYGALGVVGPDRRLTDFITHGMTREQAAHIGDLPHGRGVLGLLIQDPRPVRMPDITQHPQSYGFPANHPPMHSFLGVPLRIREHVFGNLYLADKQGAAEFTVDDEEVVVALAAAAGVAIENARLYAISHRREQWLAAAAEITGVLLSEVRRTDALSLIARRAREVSGAHLVLVLLYDADADRLTVEVVDGHSSVSPGVQLVASETAFLPAVTGAGTVTVDSLAKAAAWPGDVPGGPAMIAPLGSAEALHGALVVVHDPAAIRHDDDDLTMLGTFAGQAALALERARAQEEREMLVVLEDRERIARDLHDVVIQRLFATGLHLQTAIPLAGRPEAGARINAAVDDLDSTIRDIRRAIFELRTPVAPALRADLGEMVDAAAIPLGFRPRLDLFGPVDSAVPDAVRDDLLAVLREALSNVVKHARATVVEVGVRVAAGRLTLTVLDNGVGCPPDAARSGLVNLGDRATTHDGTFDLTPAPAPHPSGTLLTWSIPI